MQRILIIFLAVAIFAVVSSCSSGAGVQFIQKENQIDIMVNGKFFTSYLYKPELTKPILWPVKTPAGFEVTRGYPFKEVEGESHDHPHHTGVFFTYDKVNNDGFWNNTKTPPQIKHIKILEMTDGKEQGTLSVLLHWVGVSGKTLLEEKRTMIFTPKENEVDVDFTMTLTAKDTAVVFHDTKEGMFAIRVAHWLREKGGTGRYLNSRGAETAQKVWGRRAEWVRLQGEKDGQKVGIAIFNHPTSTNFPTYWHARNYGLFAANPLGQSVFQKTVGEEEVQPLNLTLQQGESALFKFLMVFYDGPRSKEQLDQIYQAYSK